MRYTIKWRFLLKLTVVLVAAGVAVYFTHRWQVRRLGGTYLREADAARDSGEKDREADYLQRYLIANPGDLDSRERLARIMCEKAKTGRQLMEAFLVVEDVLRRGPDRDALRRYAVDFAMDPRLGMFKEARGHAELLLAKQPGDGELEAVRAKCLLADQQYMEAAEAYRKSAEHKPDLVDSHFGRAAVLRVHLKQPEMADQVIEDMRTKNRDRFRAHLLWAGYWQAFDPEGKAGQIGAAVDQARRLAPEERDVLLAAADAARIRARALDKAGKREEAAAAVEEARGILRRCVELHPKAADALVALAALERDPLKAEAIVRAAVEATPDSPALLLALLESQLRAGDAAGAAGTVEKVRKVWPPDVAEFAHARVLCLQDKWKEAAPALERVAPGLKGGPFGRQAYLLLGRCFEQFGDQQRRLDALARAEPESLDPADPVWAPAMQGTAEAQTALGRVPEAVTTYRKLAAHAPAAWAQVARLETAIALSKPAGERDWSRAEEALAKFEAAADQKRVPDATEARLLRALLTHHKGDAPAARRQLEDLKAERPKEAAVWVELAMQHARDGNRAAGLAAIDEAEKPGAVGDSPDLRSARARLWVDQWFQTEPKDRDPGLPAKVAGLAAGAEKFGAGPHHRLLRVLAELVSLMGEKADEEAGRLWQALAAARPDDLVVQTVLFDRASRKGDLPAMEAALGKVAGVDGESGPFARLARAILLTHQSSRQNDRGPRDRALALLDGLERERVGPPLAGRVAVGQALIYDLNKDWEAAARSYQRAVDLGEVNPATLRRLMELYTATRRYDQVVELFKKLPTSVKDRPDVQRLMALGTAGAGDPKEALGHAVKAIPEDSKNPQDLLLLGQYYLAAGDKEKPEKLFRRAVEVGPDSAGGWLVLIQYLVQAKRAGEAEKVLEDAKGKVKPADRAMFLALAHAQLGQGQKTVDAFREARKEKPGDVPTLATGAEYLLQVGRLADARDWFDQILKSPTATPAEKKAATQRLALAYAADPDEGNKKKALELIGGAGGAAAADTPAGQRARAAVFALQSDRAGKLEAVRLLEGAPEGRTPNEDFLLAQLYAAAGDAVKSRNALKVLLGNEKNQLPLYVAYYVQALLRDGDRGAEEAEKWAAKLAEADPESLQTAVLRARVAAARKDPEKARQFLLPREGAPDAPLGVLARVYEELGLYDDAERVLKVVIEKHQKAQPGVVLALAAFYGRRGRTAEALGVCEKVRANPEVKPADVGGIAVIVLYNARPPAPEHLARVVGWLEEAAGKADPKARPVLTQQLASVRNLEGKFAAAIQLYEEAVKANPKDALALNNLAYLISADPKTQRHDEALGLIDRAKQILGPNPDLLDTEAMVLLNRGNAAAAVKIMQGVVAEAPTGTGYFHLALAQFEDKQETDARGSWKRAAELGFGEAEVHPLERPAYERLARAFR